MKLVRHYTPTNPHFTRFANIYHELNPYYSRKDAKRQVDLFKVIYGERNRRYIEALKSYGDACEASRSHKEAARVRAELDAIWEEVQVASYGMSVDILWEANAAMLEACSQGNLEKLAGALKSGAISKCVDPTGKQAIHVAASKGHLDILEYLHQEHGVDIDAPKDDHESKSGVRSRGEQGWRPIHYALANKHIHVARWLQRKGVALPEKDSFQYGNPKA